MPSSLRRRVTGLVLAVGAAAFTPLGSLPAVATGTSAGDLEGSTADRAGYADAVISADRVVVPMIFPVVGGVTYSDTFLACRSGCTRKHLGQDLMSPKMRPLVATFTGYISSVKAETTVGEGSYFTLTGDNGWSVNYIHINNDTPGTDDGRGTAAFAFAPGLQRGTRVIAGQLLGWSGDSGNAENTGPHTHFELRKGGPWDGVVYNAMPSLDAALRLTTPRVAGPHPDGTVIRSTIGGATWVLSGGRKRRLPDHVFALNGYATSQVVRVSLAEIEYYPRTFDLTVRDGTAVKAPDGSLWIVVNGARVLVPDLAAMTALGVPAENVRAVDAASLTQMRAAPAGTALPGKLRSGALVRLEGDNRVWLIEGDQRRWIPDPVTFASWGYRWADVITLPATALDAQDGLAEGEPAPAIPTEGTPLLVRDGTIVRQASTGASWIVSNGARRHVSSLPAFRNYGYASVPVRTLPDSSLLRHPFGNRWPS